MIVRVKLYDEELGSVEWNDSKGSATFQYSVKALQNGIEPSPILMPKQEKIFVTYFIIQN